MVVTTNDNIDDQVDKEISDCLNLDSPKSFFLFAGAGSGKTRSLVNALKDIQKRFGHQLKLNSQKVGVITYTNAACNEILSRIDNTSLFNVTTIHSFAWELIKPFTIDIKCQIQSQIKESILDLEEKQAKSRGINKTSIDRANKIDAQNRRLAQLDSIVKFTYSPNGENKGRDFLNHSEVIDLASNFLANKKLMQLILIRKYPILLIDESQDTNKNLIDAFFSVEQISRGQFSLGLIGDMMQRIYLDGKASLNNESIPKDWKTPTKKLNHRCPSRVVELINKIREHGDGQKQEARSDAKNGTVRLFVVESSCVAKMETEATIAQRMADLSNDNLWVGESSEVQVLTLEHHMAAQRMGFSQLFEPLYNVSKLKTGVLDGTNSGLRFFYKLVLPLYESLVTEDKFLTAKIIKEYSVLLSQSRLEAKKNQIEQIQTTKAAVNSLFSLWKNSNCPSLLEVLKNIYKSELFPVPETLSVIARRSKEEIDIIRTEQDHHEESDEIIDAWDIALEAPFSQVALYSKYIAGEGNFDTHQGVKGREFPRVMVILDDDEARGFLFSYEKLFGVKPQSETDEKSKAEGKETGFDRTLRLFYVTCSRAKSSLAIVAYTNNPDLLVANVIQNGWFTNEEIIRM